MLGTQKGNEFRFQLLIGCKENKFFVLLEFLVVCIAQLQCLRSDYLNAIAVVTVTFGFIGMTQNVYQCLAKARHFTNFTNFSNGCNESNIYAEQN